MRTLLAGLVLIGALALTATNANAWCDNWLGRGCDSWNGGWGGWGGWNVGAYGPGYATGGFGGQTVIIIIPGGGGRYYGGAPYNGGGYSVGPYYGGGYNVGPYYGGQYYQPGYRW